MATEAQLKRNNLKLRKRVNELTANCERGEAIINSAREGFMDPLGNFHFLGDDGEWKTHLAENEDAEDSEEDLATNSESNDDTKAKTPMTDQEWLASAPPSIRSAVENSMRIEADAKKALVDRLIANIQGDDVRQKKGEFLMGKSLDELKELVSLMPEPTAEKRPVYYFGAGGAPTSNHQTKPRFTADDLLPIPTTNYESPIKNKN